MISYKLTRSNRKTIAIYIRNGEVEVRAPLKTSMRNIDKFIKLKEEWIIENLKISKEKREQKDNFRLSYGDNILFRGKEYIITKKDGTHAGFDGKAFYLPDNLPPEYIKNICIEIYRNLAKMILNEKVLHFAELLKVNPIAVKINGAKTHWGSCSGKKSLNFSWRLIMADDNTIDYVVVHELSHIIEMNHSARFWTIVENVLPDYKFRKEKLKKLQEKLSSEAWE